jgi:hypothetical protein
MPSALDPDTRPLIWAYIDQPALLELARMAVSRRLSLPDIAGELLIDVLRRPVQRRSKQRFRARPPIAKTPTEGL